MSKEKEGAGYLKNAHCSEMRRSGDWGRGG